MSESILESLNISASFVPVDMQTAANTGDWVSMKNHQRLLAVLFKAIGTAGDDPVFKLQQAKDNAGTGAKDLNFTVIYSKVGTLASLTKWTRTTQTAATSYTDAVSAESQGIIAVEIQDTDLDVAGGFTHVQLSVADIGTNAQLGCAFYLSCYPRYAGPVADQPDPLA